MKKGYTKLLIFSLLLIVLFSLNSIFNILSIYTYAPFLFVLFTLLILIIGFESDRFRFKKDIILIIIMACILYLITTYLSGLFLGFVKTSYSLKLINIIKNTIPLFFIIILSELIRYNLVRKSSRYKNILFLVVILLTLMDLTLLFKAFDLTIGRDLVKFITVYVLPSISKNIFLTYLTYKVGYKPAIVYRLILEIYVYLVPIFPNLGMYMETVINILLPVILIYIIYKVMNTKNEDINEKSKVIERISLSVSIILILIVIILTSGWFKYYSLTIGSGSMEPYISIGDTIIVEKKDKNDFSKLEIGDILVYKHTDKVIVHRITDINEKNNVYTFYTKGDANESADAYSIAEEDVIGIATLRIPYIGSPVIWLKDAIFKK